MAMIDEALQAFLNRLTRLSSLAAEEQAAILALADDGLVEPSSGDLVRPGQTVDHAILVAEGVLARYDLMRTGARQITAFHIPGDVSDLQSVVAPVTGWGVAALGPVRTVRLPHRALRRLATRYPAIALAFWRDTTLDASILAKGMANIGRKTSHGRLAHLFCEFGLRMERAGRGSRNVYPLPVTQEQLGDAVGLTGVHVNRTLRALRDEGLVSFSQQRVAISDWDRLAAAADFDSLYLLPDEPRVLLD